MFPAAIGLPIVTRATSEWSVATDAWNAQKNSSADLLHCHPPGLWPLKLKIGTYVSYSALLAQISAFLRFSFSSYELVRVRDRRTDGRRDEQDTQCGLLAVVKVTICSRGLGRDAVGGRVWEMGRGYPLLHQTEGLRERHEIPQPSPGLSASRK